VTASSEEQLDGFIRKFERRHQRLIRAVRKTLRKRFPTAYELAYDNYSFFVIGYSPTDDSVYTCAADGGPWRADGGRRTATTSSST
jgi:hypothetical protein